MTIIVDEPLLDELRSEAVLGPKGAARVRPQ